MATDLYAVRGGEGHGLYDTYADALDAGWLQRQGYGNAVKFPARQREFAEQWLARSPLPNGRAASVQTWIQKQHFLVRLTLTSLIATISLAGLFHMLVYLDSYIGCDKSVVIATTPMCIGITNVKTFVTSKIVEITNLVFAQIVSGIGVFAMYLGGMLH